MLAHSSSLGIGPYGMADDRRERQRRSPEARARPTPVRSTRMIRLRGSDLIEFLAGQITRDEAMKRIVEVRTF